ARPLHRPEPVAEPVRREPEHRAAVVDVLPRLEARAQDHLLPALAAGHADREDHRRRRPVRRRRRGGGGRLLAGEPRVVRGLPMNDDTNAASAGIGGAGRPARLLDPGMCLTLRPMSHPRFFEMYRAAIKNTWTVE